MLPSLRSVTLCEATMPGVPVEILGKDCLDRLRAYLFDANRGDDVKSQIAR
jgi:hypothetical protein